MNVEEMKKRIIKKVRNGKMVDNSFLDNALYSIPADIKHDYIDNGKILVLHEIPVAKEIVQPYKDSDGKTEWHYKPADEIEQLNLEDSPIVMYHQDKHFDEMSDEEILDNVVGFMRGGFFKNTKKYADFYLFVDKLNESRAGKITIQRVRDGQSVDVSIGFRSDNEKKSGSLEGKNYDTIQRNIRIDHLALLPEGVGRCSITEGCGLGSDSTTEDDSMSDSKMMDQLVSCQADMKTAENKHTDDLKAKDATLVEKDEKIADLEKQIKAKDTELDKIKTDAKELDDKKKEAIADVLVKCEIVKDEKNEDKEDEAKTKDAQKKAKDIYMTMNLDALEMLKKKADEAKKDETVLYDHTIVSKGADGKSKHVDSIKESMGAENQRRERLWGSPAKTGGV